MWYDDIEDEIMIRDQWSEERTTLEPIERDILKAEIKSLSDDRFKKSSTSVKAVKHVYFSESGLKMTVDEQRYKQETKWINRFIQKSIGSAGLIMSQDYIRALLEQQITNVFISADLKNVQVRTQRTKQLHNLLQNAS